MRAGRLVSASVATLITAALALSLTACSNPNDDLASDYREGSGKGYVAGEFATTEWAPDERAAPIAFTGTLDDGSAFSSDALANDVTVVNFWYAACAPCRAEAPVLEQLATQFAGQDVQFLGVNIYDQAPTAQAFAGTFGVSYPSIIDIEDKNATAAFAEFVPLRSVPVTVVLDREGRPAARIIGQVKEPSILATMVRDTLAEAP